MKWEVSISFPLQSKVKIEFVDRLRERLETLQGAWHNTDTSLLELGKTFSAINRLISFLLLLKFESSVFTFVPLAVLSTST